MFLACVDAGEGLNHLPLVYQEYGDKNAPLMVFLHGGGVSSWMWDKQIHFFSHYHCLTIDLPEHGASINTEPFSILSSAEKVNKIIEEKARNKTVIVVGFSLGAQVAVQMLSINPNLIDYAVINSAFVRPAQLMKKLIKPSIKWFYPFIKNKYFAKLQARTLYIHEEYFDDYYRESSQMPLGTLIRILEENMSFKTPDLFYKSTAKILVTVGEKEKRAMKKSAQDLVSAHANCTGIIIPNVGHGIPLANPDFFNKMVNNWLKNGTLPKEVEIINP